MEEMLLGTGPYSDLILQLILTGQVYGSQQMTRMMKQAWSTIPMEGIATQSFLHILQGSWWPYAQILAM